MSNSEVSDISINWASEATAPLSSWADEMDELDALEPRSPSVLSYDDSQATSSSSSDNEDDRKSSPRELRSDDLRDSSDRMPRSSSNHSLNRSGGISRTIRDSSSDLSSAPRTSVKEQVPFPVTGPFVAFITNVHADASREDISKALEPLTGMPKSVKIILNKDTGRPRGFCYVEFEEAAGLQAAIDADGFELMGQALHIVVAEQKPVYNGRNSFSGSHNPRRGEHSSKNFNPRRSDDHDSRSRHPRSDSASQSSRGKFDNQGFRSSRPQKDEFKFQTVRSNSFANDKRSSAGVYREKPKDFTITTKPGGQRKVEEKAMSVGNIFAALQLTDDM